MHQETQADDNEVRILECRALEQRTSGTRLDITRLDRATRGLVDAKLRSQKICNPYFEREIKLVRM